MSGHCCHWTTSLHYFARNVYLARCAVQLLERWQRVLQDGVLLSLLLPLLLPLRLGTLRGTIYTLRN